MMSIIDLQAADSPVAKDYPQAARAFVKANSTLPSSVAVERLFNSNLAHYGKFSSGWF